VRCVVLTTSLLLCCLPSRAQTSMECERYQVAGDLKTERSVHRFELNRGRSAVTYEVVSGRSWLPQSPTALSVSWSSRDGLRAVAIVVAAPPQEQRLQGSVYAVDLDFGIPRVRVESFGGAADLDEVVNDPWKIECRRLN
jgi:hypothetical protein